jgi:hypothetical protein
MKKKILIIIMILAVHIQHHIVVHLQHIQQRIMMLAATLHRVRAVQVIPVIGG